MKFYILHVKNETRPDLLDVLNEDSRHFSNLREIKNYLETESAQSKDFDIYMIETNVKKVKLKA